SYGGRWNWPGLSRAVYGTFDPEAALAEANSHAHRLGVVLADNLPRSMEAFRVDLSEVLDLTTFPIQAQLRLPPDLFSVPWERAISEGWETLTHAIGRAAFEERLEAIIVPCAPKPEMKNLIVFRENLKPRSTITYY
ncbi:MAG: RES family NAD+ phosphorylase, partial [Armatimonadota bacterium]|nr:RES family NAD+ phosphorylase [Armatimonadota bacterium]